MGSRILSVLMILWVIGYIIANYTEIKHGFTLILTDVSAIWSEGQ